MKYKLIVGFSFLAQLSFGSEIAINTCFGSDIRYVNKFFKRSFPGYAFNNPEFLKLRMHGAEVLLESQTDVLRENNRIVGCVTSAIAQRKTIGDLSLCLSSYGFLANVCIDPNYRRKGYGEKIVQHAIAKLKEKHVSSIYLEVDDDNNIAIQLYKKFGFKKSSKVNDKSHYYELIVKDDCYIDFASSTLFLVLGLALTKVVESLF